MPKKPQSLRQNVARIEDALAYYTPSPSAPARRDQRLNALELMYAYYVD
jgi:hypothetical protein